MSVLQDVSTGQWIVTYQQEEESHCRYFPLEQEQQARLFDAEQSENHDHLMQEKQKDTDHDPWDRRALYLPVVPKYIEDYDRLLAEGITLAEAIVLFLENVPHCKEYETNFKNLVFGNTHRDGVHRQGAAEELAMKKVKELTRFDLEKVRNVVRSQNGTTKTINKAVSQIKTVLNWCTEQDFLPENPWKKYKNLPEKHGSRQGTLEEFRALYPYLPPWLKWASVTALGLCLRPGLKELFSLKWENFSWTTGTVSIWMPKVEAMKTVYPPDEYLEEAHRRFTVSLTTGQQLVCPDAHGRQVTHSWAYSQPWKQACLRAGVDIPFYALRHIAASEMLAGGADLAAVAAQLGHKNITTTGKFYAHAVAGAQKRAAELLPLPGSRRPSANS